MALTDQLLTVARTFCAARNLSIARVSTLVFNSGKKLSLLDGGADLSTKSYEQAMVWFSVNWPDGATWPEGIERPAAEPVIEAVQKVG